MSVTSGFFNSSNGDRRYTAEQFSALIDNLITDGVFATVGEAFAVTASGASVNIGIGRAWFNSVWVYNDTLLPMAILSPEMLNDRIDAVVIEINHTESVRAGSIKMVRGTPANTPQWPELTNTDTIHQYPLAYIYRTAGAAEITQADITNMVGTTACPFVTGILQTISVDGLLAQWESEFNNWFSELDATLDGDVATALAGKILDLEGQFQSLAMERAVYMDLNDSSDDDILDSNGNIIRVATRFPEGGKGEVIINPTNGVEESLEVGDILETARTDLGDNWLLCNGGVYNKTDYPALGAVLQPGPGGEYNLSTIWSPGFRDDQQAELTDILFVNGYYIVAGYSYEQWKNSICKARIAYATSLEGPWTIKDIWTGFTASINYITKITKIKYLNGYYVAIGTRLTGPDNFNTKLAYTTDLTGEWTVLSDTAFNSPTGSFYAHMAYDIIYANGYYTVAGQYRGNSASIWNSQSLDGPWTRRDMWTSSSNDGYINSIIFADSRYMMTGFYRTSNMTYGHIKFINGNNPTSGSTYFAMDKYSLNIAPINYLDGKYVVGVRYTNENNEEPVSTIRYCSSTSFGLSMDINAWSIVEFPDHFVFKSAVQYANGFYYVVGTDNNSGMAIIAYSQALEGPWMFKDIWAGPNHAVANNAIYQNGYWCVAGRQDVYDGAGHYTKNALLAYTDKTKLVLPSISNSDSTYAYIKASEG